LLPFFAFVVIASQASVGATVGDQLGTGGVLGATSGMMIAAGSARAFVRGDTLHLVSLCVTYLIPVSEIVGVEADNGMAIRVASGEAIGSMGFGPSVIAKLTGNRRGKRAARRLTAIVGPFGDAAASLRQATVLRQIRWKPFSIGAVLGIVGLAIGWL
jgi:hypothetical protein